MTKVYISAPITGYNLGSRKRYFAEKARLLAAKGYEPVSPLDGQTNLNLSRPAQMKRDIRLLLDCDAIMLCQGWERSQGCNVERDVAAACGLSVMSEV